MNCAGTEDPPAPRSDREDTPDGTGPPSAVTVDFFLSSLVVVVAVGVGERTTEAVGIPGTELGSAMDGGGGGAAAEGGVYVPETELLPVLAVNPVTFKMLFGPPCCPKGKTTCPPLTSSTEGELTWKLQD